MGTKLNTVPLRDLKVGQWFYRASDEWGLFRRVDTFTLDRSVEIAVMYPGGRVYQVTNAPAWRCLPVDGPDVTYEEAVAVATPKLRIADLEPGTRFRIGDETFLKLARTEYDSVAGGTDNAVVVLSSPYNPGYAYTVDGFSGWEGPIVDEVLD